MNATENLQRQHDELVQDARAIVRQLEPAYVAAHAAEVRKTVARFAGKLHVHASMEGEALYPRMLAHEDPEVRAVAQRFLDELGDIYRDFFAYVERWPSSDAVAHEPARFIEETHAVLQQLSRRVVRENAELYPVADRLG